MTSRNSCSSYTSHNSGSRRSHNGYTTTTNWGRIAALVLALLFVALLVAIGSAVATIFDPVADFLGEFLSSPGFQAAMLVLVWGSVICAIFALALKVRAQKRKGDVVVHTNPVDMTQALTIHGPLGPVTILSALGVVTGLVVAGRFFPMTLTPEVAQAIALGETRRAVAFQLADLRSGEHRLMAFQSILRTIEQMYGAGSQQHIDALASYQGSAAI